MDGQTAVDTEQTAVSFDVTAFLNSKEIATGQLWHQGFMLEKDALAEVVALVGAIVTEQVTGRISGML
uniref:hypothetical protein n=1 Tax=Marinobacterium profundum TaxID=1714300 RepID=UPI000829E854|nr:hypothetical protein [Marinobacterium profundum]